MVSTFIISSSMNSQQDHSLESNTTQLTREISESSKKTEEDDNSALKSLTKGVNNDHNASMEGIMDQDHRSEGVQSSEGGSVGQTQGTRKLERVVSDGAAATTSESLEDFANKIRHFRSRSTVPDYDGKLPYGSTSQGDNSGHYTKWPTVSTDIKHPRSRSSVPEVFDPNKVVIETKAPIDSVKSAVSKFGRIANKTQPVERVKVIDEEIEKVQEEIPLYKEQAEIAEQSKVKMLKELDTAKRLIEDLKMSLEKAQAEESQAHQDSQLAKLRLEELTTGVGHEASVVAKTELEMARNRHQAAIANLKYVKQELESLHEKYTNLRIEKDVEVKKAEEVVSAAKEMEATVETLTVELVSTKEALESAHAAYLEAEEHRIGALLVKEQDLYTWDKELKEIQDNLVDLNQRIESAKVLKSKLSTAVSRRGSLKAELAAYMDPKPSKQGEKGGERTHAWMQAVTLVTTNEVEDVRRRLNKASDEVNCLKMASTSLKTELEKEQTEVVLLRQREGMASIAVASLEAELEKINLEIDVVHKRGKEAREKMADLPRQLQQASKEMEEAKSEAELAHHGMKIVKEEAELAKAVARTIERKLAAARKEVEATRASERLALAVIKVFRDSESTDTSHVVGSSDKVTLLLEDYYELSKKAHEAQELANERVAEAVSMVEAAKEDELKSMKRLEEAMRDVEERKGALHIAREKAERAQEGKLRVEQELRKRRSEHERRRKAEKTGHRSGHRATKSGEEGQGQSHPAENQTADGAGPAHNDETSPKGGVFGHTNTTKKKKKSMLPKFFMFLGKKHWKSSSKSQ